MAVAPKCVHVKDNDGGVDALLDRTDTVSALIVRGGAMYRIRRTGDYIRSNYDAA